MNLSDWDIVYGLTYEALNRKLTQLFYQQRNDKHLVKQVVAWALAPTDGLSGGFTASVKLAGNYATPPTLKVSYFDEELQQEQPQGSYQPVMSADGKQLIDIKRINSTTPLPVLLFYPPGIEVQRAPNDTSLPNALVLTGLQVGRRETVNANGAGTVYEVLKQWLTGKQGIVSQLNTYFATGLGGNDVLEKATDYLGKLPTSTLATTELATFCGTLLEWLLTNIWQAQPFWMSSYLKTLHTYKTASFDELRSLYAYAMHLRAQAVDKDLLGVDEKTLLAGKNKTQEEKTKLKTEKTQKLKDEIKIVYDYFHVSEIRNIRREAVFRAQEALLKEEFDFDNGKLTRWKLNHSVPTAGAPQALAQALLEAFACLVPTVLPDLLFDAQDNGPAFAIRLAPWQIAIDSGLDGLNIVQLKIPLLGGFYYESKTSFQSFDDRKELFWRQNYDGRFVELVHRDPGYKTSTTANSGYVTSTAFLGDTTPSTVLGLGAATLAALDDHLLAATDAEGYDLTFNYAYANLFASWHMLDDLPTLAAGQGDDSGAVGGEAGLAWAKITTYRFRFKQLSSTAGQLYIAGSVRPAGVTTELPNPTGGLLNQLPEGSDAFLFVAKQLLMEKIFLPNIPGMFRVANGAQPATTTDFVLTNSKAIQNKQELFMRYGDLRNALAEPYRSACDKGLGLAHDALFAIPAGGFTFEVRDNGLRIGIARASHGKEIELAGVGINFTYEFEKRNGLKRYKILADSELPTLTFTQSTVWSHFIEYGNYYGLGFYVLANLGIALFQYKKAKQELRTIVVGPPAPDADLQQLLSQVLRPSLDQAVGGASVDIIPAGDESRVGLVDRQLNRAGKNKVGFLNSKQRKVYLLHLSGASIDLPVISDPDIHKAKGVNGVEDWSDIPDNGVHPNQSNSPPQVVGELEDDEKTRLVAAPEDRLRKKYSTLIYKYLHGEVPAEYPISFYKGAPLFENGPSYSLSLVSILGAADGSKHKLVNVRLTGLTSTGLLPIQLQYSYDGQDIATLKFDSLLPKPAKQGDPYALLNQFNIGEVTLEEGKYQEAIEKLLTKEFVVTIQERLLETVFLRRQKDTSTRDFWSAMGGTVVEATYAPALLLLQQILASSQAAAESQTIEMLNYHFLSSFMQRKLDAIKFPYEEHFDINQLVIDGSGLQVLMGPLTNSTLTFMAGQPLSQFVSAYVNVRTLTG